MERIRVLELIAGFAVEGPLGGIERFGIELSRALDRDRVEPVLCGLWRFDTPYEEQWLTQLGQERIRAFLAATWEESHPYRSFFRSYRGIVRELAGQSVDLIHSHCPFGDGIALMIAHRLGARAILRTVHNEREWPKRPARRLFLTNLLYPVSFALEIGISQQVTRNLERRWLARFLRRPSVCLYNAIDLQRFAGVHGPSTRDRKRRELGIPAQTPVIGTVGRLTRQKGYHVLLEAMSLVLQEIPDACLLIIGCGELASELQEQARQCNLTQAVRFLGPRRDVEDLLASMDLFVSSSLWEGLPTVILESMAARTPVVATAVSGSRELVEDGVTGRLVPAGEATTLAGAITQLLQDAGQSQGLAERAWHRAQQFSITHIAHQHQQVYENLAGTE